MLFFDRFLYNLNNESYLYNDKQQMVNYNGICFIIHILCQNQLIITNNKTSTIYETFSKTKIVYGKLFLNDKNSNAYYIVF